MFNGCSFSGNIDYKGSKAPKYVGGINGYSNITAGSETITNNYISGTISAGGSNKGVIVRSAEDSPFLLRQQLLS